MQFDYCRWQWLAWISSNAVHKQGSYRFECNFARNSWKTKMRLEGDMQQLTLVWTAERLHSAVETNPLYTGSGNYDACSLSGRSHLSGDSGFPFNAVNGRAIQPRDSS
jgi:hypothetical protein